MLINMFKKSKITLLSSVLFIMLIALIGCSSGSDETGSEKNETSEKQSIENLPNQMVWSVYDVGSGGYAEATAIADQMTKQLGTQIRLLPSSSGVGRMQPLENGMAFIGRLGDEGPFAFEAMYDFAEKSWGPQDLRVVWSPFSYFGFSVLENSDIETIADLKGKKVPFIVGNHSINIKTEAMLAFAGLTWDDVEVVELSEYGSQGVALKQGEIDVTSMLPSSSALFELDSLDGIRWLEMPEDDKEGWERVNKIAPWMIPATMDNGAGMSEENPADIMGYAYSVYAYTDQDEEELYAFIKALDQTYDSWKDVSPNLVNWGKENIVTDPAGVPFHDAFVKFLEEEGLWDDAKEKENNELIERGKKLKEAWDTVLAEAEEKGINDDEFAAYWLERKADLVD